MYFTKFVLSPRALLLSLALVSAGCAAETSRGVDSSAVARPAGIVDSAAGTTMPAVADTIRSPAAAAASGPHAAMLAEWRNPASSPVIACVEKVT